jgi:hypothetical protein
MQETCHDLLRDHLSIRQLTWHVTMSASDRGTMSVLLESEVRKRIGCRGRDDLYEPPPSRPGEFHPEPLTEPCVNLSIYTARAIHKELPPSATTIRFLLLPVDQHDPDANGLSPSLHGRYPTSSLLRGSPPLIGVSVLSALQGYCLSLFPSQHRSSSQVPYRSPDESHAACTPDTV